MGYSGPVVKGVTFKVEGGKVLSIIGPNAAGKSTLLKGIGKLLKPLKGKVKLYGREVKKEEIGYVPPEPVKVNLTLLEFVALGRVANKVGLRMERRDLEKAYEAIRAVGLEDWIEVRVNELSTGFRQLAMIAQAMAREPRLLLLDEPTSALDLSKQVSVMQLVREYVRKNNAIAVAIHHNLDIVSEFSDYVLALKSGEVVAFGKTDEVLRKEIIERLYDVRVEILKIMNKPRVVVLGL